MEKLEVGGLCSEVDVEIIRGSNPLLPAGHVCA